MGFSYHDNTLKIRITANGWYFTPEVSQYLIKEHMVSPGQDPQNKIVDNTQFYPLWAVNDEWARVAHSVTFQFGRHGTKAVADWWNAKVPAANSTFNHKAGELNFAAIGTLSLSLSTDNGAFKTYAFQNIALGQGSSGSTNNWWFGGPNCFHVNDTSVEATGTAPDGTLVYARFARGMVSGGADPDDVAIVQCSFNPL